MTRGGKDDQQDDPERKCIVTGDSGPKSGLIRFCVGPEGDVVPDILGKLPGRGFYVSADRGALTKAATKNLFSRAARQQVKVPADLVETVEYLLMRRVTDLLSMARKASGAVMGYEKCKDWLAKGKGVVLVQASDGSERGKTTLRAPGGPETLITCLTAQEMGLSFGRERAIHAALAAGGLTARVVEEAARLAGLRIGALQQLGGETAKKDTKDA
ncbi:MAG: RNA-binding protein [Paracoccaceae bacterium]